MLITRWEASYILCVIIMGLGATLRNGFANKKIPTNLMQRFIIDTCIRGERKCRGEELPRESDS